MIKPIDAVKLNTMPAKTPYFAGKSPTTLNNDFAGAKLNVVVNGFKNCSPLGNKLDYFA